MEIGKHIKWNDRVAWVIGADEHDETGPVRHGTVYTMYPKGKFPYWKPFIMVIEDEPKTPTMNSMLNPRLRCAVMLDNPTLKVIEKT